MAQKKPALGQGLQALLKPSPKPAAENPEPDSAAPPPPPPPTSSPDAESEIPPPATHPHPSEEVVRLPISDIVPSPLQPRKKFSDEALTELMSSIREHGMIQPLIVRRVGGNYELIAGERRFRACVLLRHEEAPAIIREATDRDVLEMALIENLQREDLNPIEEAEAYIRLAREFHLRQEDIATKVGKSRAAVANSMRLLDLESSVRDLLANGAVSTGHAKALLGLKNEEEQRLLGEMIVRRKLTVRDVERIVTEKLDPKPSRQSRNSKSNSSSTNAGGPRLPGYLLHIQEQLRSHFSTNVVIQQREQKGKIEIEYYGDEQLDRILELMRLEITE